MPLFSIIFSGHDIHLVLHYSVVFFTLLNSQTVRMIERNTTESKIITPEGAAVNPKKSNATGPLIRAKVVKRAKKRKNRNKKCGEFYS